MERLMLLLLSPAILALPRTAKNPNDEPFLPIYPVYPYSPKLMKRGAEPELISQLTPELYAPKVNAKDSYVPNAYQRDAYYPDYPNPYPKSEPPPPYPSYYNGDPGMNAAYAVYNPYPLPAAPSYPAYYYQPPYYYPHYFNHALFPPPPPPPPAPSSVVDDYREPSADAPAKTEDEQQDNKDAQKTKAPPKENDAPSQLAEGGNYISGGTSRDLDVQSSTYKLGPYNQLERQAKDSSLPKTTYQVVSVAGQPVGPDYSLPASYVKAQQVNQLLAKLPQQQQADQSYEINKDVNPTGAPYQATYVAVAEDQAIGKQPAVTYIINVDNTAKVPSDERSNPLRGSLEGPSAERSSGKNAKYSSAYYGRKPVASSATWAPRGSRGKQRDGAISAHRTADYGATYDVAGSQGYGGIAIDSKEQGYRAQPASQPDSSYRSKDALAAQTPRLSYGYQYSESDQTYSSQRDKMKDLEDGNFGVKYNKG